MKYTLKYTLGGLLFLMASVNCHADNDCSNPNLYLQQTCENLRQSAAVTQKTRDEENQKELEKHETLQRKNIEEKNKPPEKPQPKIPEWQKPLKTQTTPQQQNKRTDDESDEETTTTAPTITPLPPLEPTEFANPKSVPLPGGLNIIPVKPEKGNTKGAIKYY